MKEKAGKELAQAFTDRLDLGLSFVDCKNDNDLLSELLEMIDGDPVTMRNILNYVHKHGMLSERRKMGKELDKLSRLVLR